MEYTSGGRTLYRQGKRYEFDGSEKNILDPDYTEFHDEVPDYPSGHPFEGEKGVRWHNCIPELRMWVHRTGDDSTWWPFWGWQMLYENDTNTYNMEDPKQHFIAVSDWYRNEYDETYQLRDEDEFKITHIDTYNPATASYHICRFDISEETVDMTPQTTNLLDFLKPNYRNNKLYGYDYETDSFIIYNTDLVPQGWYQYDGQDEADFNDYCIDSDENIWTLYTESAGYGGDYYYVIGYYGFGHDSEGQEITSWEIPDEGANICAF